MMIVNDLPIASFRTVEIVQDVDKGFDKDFVSKLVNWCSVKDYAYIVHDQDDTRPHIHCMIRFNCPVPTTAILNRCDSIKEGVISFKHLNKCHPWDSAIVYLVHANAPEKHLYSVFDVASNCNSKRDADYLYLMLREKERNERRVLNENG